MNTYTVYYKLPYDRATYIGAARGRSEAEAYLDFKRTHRGEPVIVKKIVPEK